MSEIQMQMIINVLPASKAQQNQKKNEEIFSMKRRRKNKSLAMYFS